MNEAFADPQNVADSLRAHTDSDADSGRLTIIDTEAVVVADSRERLDARNLTAHLDIVDATICSIEWERNSFTGGCTYELLFHESAVEETFELTPAGIHAIDAQQATEPSELSERLSRALADIDAHNPIYTFAEVSAASMANGGHFTDFEFKYAIDGLAL